MGRKVKTISSQQFAMDLEKYAEKYKRQLNNVKKSVAFQIYSSVVKKTPVDTGRARGNWHITVGTQSFAKIGREVQSNKIVDSNGKVIRHGNSGKYEVVSQQDCIDQAKEQLKSVSGDETIYIQNNLPYIVALEHGHSKQAPNGMAGLTVANMQNYIQKAIAEVKK